MSIRPMSISFSWPAAIFSGHASTRGTWADSRKKGALAQPAMGTKHVSVVGGIHDQCLRQRISLFQRREQPPDFGINRTDVGIVLAQLLLERHRHLIAMGAGGHQLCARRQRLRYVLAH